MPPEWLVAGVVGKPHGLDGAFHVRSPRPDLLVAGRSLTIDDRSFEVERRAGTDQQPLIRLAGVSDREAASSLAGVELRVPIAEAPPLDEDEWWSDDLVGCSVVDGGVSVGSVRRLLALPSCEVLEVAREGADDLLVPLIADAVRSVDVDAKVIDVDLAFLGEGSS